MTVPNPNVPEWLRDYAERGFQLVFYDTRQKGPQGAEAVQWQLKDYKIEHYKTGQNVGVKLGTEIQPGKYLVDVDLDWAGGELLAKRLLPPAGFGFGRGQRKITHVFYTTDEPPRYKIYKTPKTDRPSRALVELRGLKIDGSVGMQTMLPPSVHPSGEVIEIRANGPITHVPDLPAYVLRFALGCLFYYHLGERAFNHDARMGIAGFLLQQGLEEDDVILIMEAVAEATANSVQDVATTVRSTAKKVRNGERVASKSLLIETMGKDVARLVCAEAKKYLGGGDFQVDDKDRIFPNSQENIKIALSKLDVGLSYDQFNARVMVDYSDMADGEPFEYRGPLEDPILNRIWLEVDRLFHFRPTLDLFKVIMEDQAFRRPYHPVLNYLKELTWDGVPRLDEWLIKYGKAADTEYVRAVSSLVLIAAVRRLKQPGCKFDELLILESGQGMLKSSALRALCPKDAWFSDDLPLNVDSKQVIERTSGKWIIEAAELSGLHRSQVEHLKSMLSRQVDGPVRMAYARIAIERPRQFIIVGTTNSHAYLKDTTGNRRFWPVRVDRFNIMGLNEVRDQLWAEAVAREAKGESIRLDPKLYSQAEIQQVRRKVEDSWESILQEHFGRMEQDLWNQGKFLKLRVTTPEVFQALGVPIVQQDERSSERLSGVMQSLGFRRITVVRQNERMKGWGRDRDSLIKVEDKEE